MAQVSRESLVDQASDEGRATPPPQETPTQPFPKLKGRRKIFSGLHRMSSSQSILRLHRTPSPAYRGTGKGSISCISLSSSHTQYSHSFGPSSFGSHFSNGYSTAPTSVPSTPGETAVGDNARIRFVEKDPNTPRPLTSAPIPSEAKYTPRPATSSGVTPGSNDEEDNDYFSRPITATAGKATPKPATKRRPDFDFWKEMPFELRQHVLRFLKPVEVVKCARVSKSWYRMCFDGQLWATLDTASFYQDIPADALVNIISRAGPFARDLNLRGCVQLWDRWRTGPLADVCTNLENISLEGCRIDRSAIHSLLFQNSRLVHVNVQGLGVVTNSTLRIISQQCPSLQHLNVSWCYNVCTKGLRKVIEGCPSLRDLRAGEVRGMGDVDFMLEIFKRNTLERLVLMGCDTLTDDSLGALMEGVDNERDYLTGQAIVPTRNLIHLDISRCRQVGDPGLLALVNNVPKLEGLQLAKCHGISDTSLIPFLSTVPQLTHLDLEELDLLTNASLQELSKSPCHKTLRHLNISYCENLGDVGMLPVVKQCRQLSNLELDNTRISDLVLIEAASAVRARPPIPSTQLSRMNGKHVPHIALNMVVYDCQNVTWTGIREVLSRNAENRSSNYAAPPTRRPTPQPPSTPSCTPDIASTSTTTTVNPVARPPAEYPSQIIVLKVFYGYQPTVTAHTSRCLAGDSPRAQRLERKWAEYMIASEEAGAPGGFGPGGFGLFTGVLGRRRRRRIREAMGAVEDDVDGGGYAGFAGGLGLTGVARRRRARSGGGCFVM